MEALSTVKGGYQIESRVASNGDEIVMTLMEAARARTPEELLKALLEALDLTRERSRLLDRSNATA